MANLTNHPSKWYSNTPEHSSYMMMRNRVYNQYGDRYKDYGGRGITIDPSWETFEGFYADMGPRPSLDHSLDRIDNDGPYCKANCRWATTLTQNQNQRSNVVNPAMVIEMRLRLKESGDTVRGLSRKIAKETGLSEGTIRKVLQNRTWKNYANLQELDRRIL